MSPLRETAFRLLPVRAALGRHPVLRFYLGHALLFALLFCIGNVLASRQGCGFRGSQFLTELPLLLLFYLPLLRALRPSRARVLIAVTPFLILYAIHDVFFAAFNRVPELLESTLLPDLMDFLPSWGNALLLIVPCAYLVLLCFQLTSWRAAATAGMLPAVFLAWLGLAPGGFYAAVNTVVTMAPWSEGRAVHDHGRLFCALWRTARLRQALTELREASIEATASAFDFAALASMPKRNVHLVVLEGFIDPRRFSAVRFGASPVHPSFLPYISEARSKSPGTACGTARSEFELLCGLPAFARYNTDEFALFSGAQTGCLPSLLRTLGYSTMAHHPYRKEMYNRSRAYPGLGFAASYFLGAPDFELNAADKLNFMPDAELYQHVVKKLAPSRPSQPIFDYVLTVYGHIPYQLGARQPRVVDSDSADSDVNLIANQTYYRTKALADFIEELRHKDPESLIVAVADHNPNLAPVRTRYTQLGYQGSRAELDTNTLRETFVLIMDRDQIYPVGLIRHCQIPTLILDRLTSGRYCQHHECRCGDPAQPRDAQELQNYQSIMAQAVRPPGSSGTSGKVFP